MVSRFKSWVEKRTRTCAQNSWFGEAVNSCIGKGFGEGLALLILFFQGCDVREFKRAV